jgi:hypothetical protein
LFVELPATSSQLKADAETKPSRPKSLLKEDNREVAIINYKNRFLIHR